MDRISAHLDVEFPSTGSGRTEVPPLLSVTCNGAPDDRERVASSVHWRDPRKSSSVDGAGVPAFLSCVRLRNGQGPHENESLAGSSAPVEGDLEDRSIEPDGIVGSAELSRGFRRVLGIEDCFVALIAS